MIYRVITSIRQPFLQKYRSLNRFSYVASLDQSTTSTKLSIYKSNGTLIAKENISHTQICPHEGFLEHNPMEILNNVHLAIDSIVNQLKSVSQFDIKNLKGMGITNQRETIVCWDLEGKPLYNAIAWCDTRSKKICQEFKKKYGDFKLQTGLPVSSYFSLFKIIWMLENITEIRQKFNKGQARFGTMDSWLIYNLTGKYVTDASNASRTYLCNLKGEWDESLLNLTNMKREFLPRIIDSFSYIDEIKQGGFKGIPICSVLGDQQSSAFAHQLAKDQMKITYGTGCFLLSNIGEKPETHDAFLTTILLKHQNKIEYAYEASVECGGGTLNWAKRAKLFDSYKELNQLTTSKQDLFFFPSMGEILSPFWQANIQSGLVGLNYQVTRQDILQSLLESITFRLKDNIKYQDFQKVSRIVVDGGMTVNNQFMQMQANVFNKKIEVKQLDTAWGVARGALLSQKINDAVDETVDIKYAPESEQVLYYEGRYKRWCEARNKLYGWQ